MSAVTSLTLAEMVKAGVEASDGCIDTDQLNEDLSFLLIEKAKIGSGILNRIQNLKDQGGIKMYAEVYRWFTETSGLGLMEQARKLMHPPAVENENETTTRVEEWVEKCDWLAKYGA